MWTILILFAAVYVVEGAYHRGVFNLNVGGRWI